MMVSPTAKTRHGSMPARAVGIFLKVRESNNRPVQLQSFNGRELGWRQPGYRDLFVAAPGIT